MTATNPLGTETFWVNVYGGREYGFFWTSKEDVEDPTFSPSYRVKVRPWIPHDGGPCPVAWPITRARVRTRDGELWEDYWGSSWWNWDGQEYSGLDIIAYQIIED